MRILLVHNRYQQRGGEDAVYEAERVLLERAGHEVFVYERDNEEIRQYSPVRRAGLVRRTVWASDSAAVIREILATQEPQIAHFYNTFPLVSPAAYYVCAEAGVPVIQTIHNYRLICPGALLQRKGQPCEDCVGKSMPWPGMLHACYRSSRAQTAVVAGMLVAHRLLGTWWKRVDTYVALTEFMRGKFIEGGLPPHKIAVKPNFLHPDPGQRASEGGYALFVGRLSREKGVATLLRAWGQLPDIPLKLAGDGPLSGQVQDAAKRPGDGRIELLGWRSRDEVLGLMKGSRFLIFPSEWYEGFPVTIVEALACGVPVIGSRLGGVAEVIEDGHTGLHFEPGDPADLADKVTRLWNDGPARQRMGRAARSHFEAHYTAERNYEILVKIYEDALAGVT